MKPKLLLCLALVLSGGLFTYFNIARSADGATTNEPNEMKNIKSWKEVTVKLLVPGSSNPPLKCRIEQVQAKYWDLPDAILGPVAVFDPNTQRTYFILGGQDYYISDKSGMIGCDRFAGGLQCETSCFEAAGGLDKAIGEFSSKFDATRFNGDNEFKDGDKYRFGVNLQSAAPDCFFGYSLPFPGTSHTIEMTDGILHVDWTVDGGRGGQYTGSVHEIGQPTDYGHTGSSADF
jgi:hypothetical protein